MKTINLKIAIVITLMITSTTNAQSFLKKKEKKAFKCGYVHKESFFKKLNPMKMIQKGVVGAMSDSKGVSNLAEASITVSYQANSFPRSLVDFTTKTPGWETCGDGVWVAFTDYKSLGFSDTDGDVLIDGTKHKTSGAGSYFYGFDPENRGKKQIKITSSGGNTINFEVEPPAPLEILSVNGKTKGEDIIIDGTEDVIIELKNGDADPESSLHVQMVCTMYGTNNMFDIFITHPRNKIVVPKEAFKNFEGSPLPFKKKNGLVVTRYKHKVIDSTSAGAFMYVQAYSDFLPVLTKGDLGGTLLTNAFDKEKNTAINDKITTEGTYNFTIKKGKPFTSPPTKLMKKIGIASFVIRGNLSSKEVTTTDVGYYKIRTTTEKWFLELNDETWQKLADKMYIKLATTLTNDFGIEVIDLDKVTNAKAYTKIKPIEDKVTKTFVEKGAGGTERLLSTSIKDFFADLKITFAGDNVNERLIRELGLDGVIAVTIDLDFDFDSEGLNPKIKMVAFAPNVSFKSGAAYFELDASTQAKSLKDSKKYTGGVENVLYNMIKADEFYNGFKQAMKQLAKKEEEKPIYEKLWKTKM